MEYLLWVLLIFFLIPTACTGELQRYFLKCGHGAKGSILSERVKYFTGNVEDLNRNTHSGQLL